MTPKRTVRHRRRVAVVGSGMAGLTTAYLLHNDPRQRYEVKVFETQPQLSLDSASVSVSSDNNDESFRVDLPMRAFAGGFYANLKGMYDHLEVPYRRQQFLYQFLRYPSHIPLFQHASSNHQIPPPRPRGLSYVRWAIEAMYLALFYAYFTLCCFIISPNNDCTIWNILDRSRAAPNQRPPSISFAEYLKRIRLPQYFSENYLLPLMSSVATCTHEEILAFPAVDIIWYKIRTQSQPHYVVNGGVHLVQEALSNGVEIVTNSYVTSVIPHLSTDGQDATIEVIWEAQKNGKSGSLLITKQPEVKHITRHIETFDIVVLAVSPDIVANIFPPLSKQMRQLPTVIVESAVYRRCSFVHDSFCSFEPSTKAENFTPSLTFITYPKLKSKERNGDTGGTGSSTMTDCIHSVTPSLRVTTARLTDSHAHRKADFSETPHQLARHHNRYLQDSKLIHTAHFTRVLRTVESRRIVNEIFPPTTTTTTTSPSSLSKTSIPIPSNHYHHYEVKTEKENDEEETQALLPTDPENQERSEENTFERSTWRKNGDQNIFLVGGWCWDGMVLLEGCVESATRVAKILDRSNWDIDAADLDFEARVQGQGDGEAEAEADDMKKTETRKRAIACTMVPWAKETAREGGILKRLC